MVQCETPRDTESLGRETQIIPNEVGNKINEGDEQYP